MRKIAWLFVGLWTSMAAFGATPNKGHNGYDSSLKTSIKSRKRQDARVDAIWSRVENQITAQGDVWFKAGDYPAIINSERFLSSEDPADYDYATNLGWMLENIEQYDEALAVYVRYRKDNPKAPDAAFPEANFYFMRKAYARVPALLLSTMDSHPHPNSYRLLAHSYEKLGLYPDAIKVWKSLLAAHPDDRGALANQRKDERFIQKQTPPGS